MSFPPGVQVVTLNSGDAGYHAFDGAPYQGALKLTPSVPRVVSAEHGVIALGVINVTLGASGEFTETLLANDAEGFTPAGWTYRVDEEFANAPGRAYSILLPAAVSVVALPSLVEVEASDGTVTWQPGGTPSDTVTAAASYGLSSAAGAAVAYSRGDHAHGTPALPTVGTVAGTYAAGDDSRIVGAAQKSQNLADLGNPAAARSSLGLGTAAVQNVGAFDAAGAAGAAYSAAVTDAGLDAATKYLPLDGGGTVEGSVTVADGNLVVDSTGTAINAVDRGAASNFAAYVLRTGGVDRWAWQMVNDGSNDLRLTDSANGASVLRVVPGVTPVVTFDADVVFAGVGGGGSSIRTAKVTVTDDNLAGLPSAAAWTIVQTSVGTRLQCSIAASVGDRVRVVGRFMRAGSHFLDWVLLDNAGAIAIYAGSETSSPLSEGDPAEYPSLSFSYDAGPPMFTVGPGHLAAGLVTVALAHQGTGAGVVYAHTTYPWKLRLENIGPEPA